MLIIAYPEDPREDRRCHPTRHAQNRGGRAFGAGSASVKRSVTTARKDRCWSRRDAPAPSRIRTKDRGGSLRRDLEDFLGPPCSTRCEFHERITGVPASDSTVIRTLKRLGESRETVAGNDRTRLVAESCLAELVAGTSPGPATSLGWQTANRSCNG